ncbi:hypothetical protein P280DRAFT_144912 [Massarina eburnea CBS 473.64]|uniref:Protein kinase domain-containing protein n=1 Tax=Massarina eburnea CBS 473.64 TaxID=1395130 RepID=A0A6A6RSE1_9PLEO|nr:hypothetical protein P280DRAFT_144912 [Massarina eburnea CBS 473.64]
MHADNSLLRWEGISMCSLHQPVGGDFVETQSWLGSFETKSQWTGEPESSWLCLRPQFGRPLSEFGWYTNTVDNPATRATRPIDSFFVWHIFLSLLEALSYIHSRNVTNNNVCLQNVVLNLYPVHAPNWFRDWPDVVLADFSTFRQMSEQSEREEVVAFLWLMRAVVEKYSDVGMLRKAGVDVTTTPLFVFLGEVEHYLEMEEDMTMAGVEHRWKAIALTQRERGPQIFPEALLWAGRNELIDADGLGRARAIVCKFEKRADDFRAYARAMTDNWPIVYRRNVEIGEGRERRIARGLCTIKISRAKAYFLGDIGGIKKYTEKRYGEAKYEEAREDEAGLDESDAMEVDE